MAEPVRAELMGLAFDPASMQSAVEQCLQWCSGPRASHTVITANAGVLCMMRRDPELQQACRSGDLVLADGMSVVWALRLASTPVPERVTGVDLMSRLLEAGAARGLRVFFLGAKEEVVRQMADSCAASYPGLVVAGFRNGYFSEADHPAVLEQIRQSRPDMLFVGMPSPFKEVFLERNRALLEVPILMGVGGSFDVLAGAVARAPSWLQAVGMEWSWRLLMEPRKMWKRYLTTNTEFLWTAGREALARRLGAST
ncbi:MAG TPA: WecB/TagA/CpsF family glycosyltransferase [Myxococcaceae bacterium]